MNVITNRQRLDYILDWLAEPFPEKAQLKSCACGASDQAGKKEEKKESTVPSDPSGRFPSKRELIEEALLTALKTQTSTAEIRAQTLEMALNDMDETEIGQLLKLMPVDLIDRHLSDMSLFRNPLRPTSLQEIEDWDTRHAKDFY